MPVQERRRQRRPAKKPMVRILLISIVAGIFISLLCMVPLAFLMTVRTLSDSVLIVFTAFLTALGALVCGFVTTFLMGRNGLLNGLLGGFWMFFTLFLIGIFSNYSFQFSKLTLIQFLCSLVAGIVGGLLAVNLMPKKRRQTAVREAGERRRQR
ncbi:MAG: TIGR04086 family membrane protein [Eubacteriales bacterium]|jgi:putative membrane protein (TIGR04086 family)